MLIVRKQSSYTKIRHSHPREAFEIHRLDSGHFAVEDCLNEIASTIQRFYDKKVAALSGAKPTAPGKTA